MSGRMFKARMDEAQVIRKQLQQALTKIDKAAEEAISTEVVLDLKTAHELVCLGITFLTDDATRNAGYGVRGARVGFSDEDFIKHGGEEADGMQPFGPGRASGFIGKGRQVASL